MEQPIPSSGQGRTRTSAASLVSALMTKTSIAIKLRNSQVDYSDRILSLRLPIQDNNFAAVLSEYVRTLRAEKKNRRKRAFYSDLHNLLQQVDSKDKLLI